MQEKFIVVIAAYFLLDVAYSFRQEVTLLDVFLIAAGFLLRVLGGAWVIRVQVSGWTVPCSIFISQIFRSSSAVFLSTGNRPHPMFFANPAF